MTGGEGKVVPRCASDGELTVSGVPVDNGPVYCRDLRKIVAVGFGVSGVKEFPPVRETPGGGKKPQKKKNRGRGKKKKKGRGTKKTKI